MSEVTGSVLSGLVRKLPPAVLAALGLSACVDGCGLDDLPVVGELFGDDEADVHPCLKVALPPQPAPDVRTDPCLMVVLPPVPAPEEQLQPCLSMPPPPHPAPPAGPRGGQHTPRADVLRQLVDAGILPDDVVARAREEV